MNIMDNDLSGGVRSGRAPSVSYRERASSSSGQAYPGEIDVE
jgi:hypothetical protein